MPNEDGTWTAEEAAALQQAVEAAKAENRKLQLTHTLEKLGAPTAIADVYNGEMDESKIKEFVMALQMQKQSEDQHQQDQQKPDVSKWGAYERINDNAAPTGGGDNELEALLKEGTELIDKSNPRTRPWKVSEEEIEEQRRFQDKVNKIHREWEREVRLGRAEPAYRGMEGFGGRLDPPRWAYRAQDGEMIGMRG